MKKLLVAFAAAAQLFQPAQAIINPHPSPDVSRGAAAPAPFDEQKHRQDMQARAVCVIGQLPPEQRHGIGIAFNAATRQMLVVSQEAGKEQKAPAQHQYALDGGTRYYVRTIFTQTPVRSVQLSLPLGDPRKGREASVLSDEYPQISVSPMAQGTRERINNMAACLGIQP